MADFEKIIPSSPFTFLVGDNQTPLTIHSAIVQDISDPLYALINNGHMKESNAGVATLEDVEVETFIGFCQFAYTGVYVTPNFLYQLPDGQLVKDGEELEHKKPSVAPKKKKKPVYWSSEDESFKPPVMYPYGQLWEQFRSLKFSGDFASLSPTPDILFHAKLYVFATKFLIEPLRQQCLKSLHRDLCDYSLNRENASLIIDLLDFTYTHTGRGEPGGKSQLRDLVIHYTACEARTLVNDENLTKLLDSNGEMGSDLVRKLV